MTYEKPELMVLSFAGTAVRQQADSGTGTSGDSHQKFTTSAEAGLADSGDSANAATSSSGGAYESDE